MEHTSNPATKPYFLRAIFEWCTDNGFTPYIAVMVDGNADVPVQYVHNAQIILNISTASTSSLKMDNDAISFKARFNGVPRDIYVPIENVTAIYARENGEGMAFETPKSGEHKLAPQPENKSPDLRSVPTPQPKLEVVSKSDPPPDDTPTPPKGGRPILTSVK